ncbi:pilus assembly protein TadG-related protein [Bradyrhizobium sp. NDS-1]|uniref:pilus assembly protein TadG-related protein n=1 Tax=Bradyrhizobium sp. NDS-1 TaxID=3080014 RepID=UPI00293F1291|nr:pilus assembly protein TadG-related protein [Bradyrhizobium sp. NDS-1]WOH76378.1 pilus assembly protein TadG-related protein [Bradyrhizobium sp. NDS-1]
MKLARHLLFRFASDDRGNVAIIGASMMTLVIGCAALGVDVGSIFADRRKAQSAADLAAIVAAGNLNNATNAASATVVRNNYPAKALVSVELGTYAPNAAVVPDKRFVTPATGAPTAARVTLETKTPLHFARYITGSSEYTIRTSATASSTALASFAIGSRLLAVNGGLINAVLGSMLGTNLSLTAMDYQALANARIDAFDFLSALATRASVTGPTYDNVLTGNIKMADLITAMLATQQSTNGNNAATITLSNIAQAVSGQSTRIAPGSLLNLGPYGSLAVGQKPKIGVSLSLLNLLSGAAAVANGTNQIATSVNLNLPGITQVSVVATIGERPVGSGWFAVGAQGASVHTAQTRVLITIQLAGSGGIPAVNLPIYVEVAAGTATLSAISCGRPDISSTTVSLGVTPGVVDAWVGNVTIADMTNFRTKPNPPPATLLSVAGVSVTGRAHAEISNSTAKQVDFTYSDIQAQTIKTVTTTNFTSSLMSSLLRDMSLTVTSGPLALPLPGVGSTVANILSGATSSIDQILAGTLAALGVGIGQADVWVSGVRCDGAVLVN